MSPRIARRVSHRLGLVVVVGLAACQRAPASSDGARLLDSASTPTLAASTAAPVASAPTVPTGAPLSRLVPKPQTGPRAACPLGVVPGVSFGPIALGETLEDLRRGGLVVTNVSETHADVTFPGKADPGTKLGVTLCAGKIIDIWIDDLRLTTACVTYEGKPIAPTMPLEELEKMLGGCEATAARIGGAFERCNGGGVYVGHGMGNFIQLRVKPKAFPFDDACAFASDDGSLVELSPKERSSILKQTLNLSELSKYWHPSTTGRDPLRLVRTPLVAEEKLTMFGSPVVWIDAVEARTGTAFFTLSKLEATATKATVAFAYPIEGIAGTAVFKHTGLHEAWRLESASVVER